MMQNKPDWLRVRVKSGRRPEEVFEMLGRLSLSTVCEEAACPNLMECFGRRTATFMISGKACTRNCTFCNVSKGKPEPIDSLEPRHVAEAVKELNLKHVVITSVTRDDLPDGGAGHFAGVIAEIRKLCEKVAIEVLIPDFKGSTEALNMVVEAEPDIINHNVETVPRLYDEVRPMAEYRRSLMLLAKVKKMNGDIYTKSGIMLGLGETDDEVLKVMRDLRWVGCDFLTIGQYLAPSVNHHPVVEYITPQIFELYREIAVEMGFKHVASAPLVRSSYLAGRALARAE